MLIIPKKKDGYPFLNFTYRKYSRVTWIHLSRP